MNIIIMLGGKSERFTSLGLENKSFQKIRGTTVLEHQIRMFDEIETKEKKTFHIVTYKENVEKIKEVLKNIKHKCYVYLVPQNSDGCSKTLYDSLQHLKVKGKTFVMYSDFWCSGFEGFDFKSKVTHICTTGVSCTLNLETKPAKVEKDCMLTEKFQDFKRENVLNSGFWYFSDFKTLKTAVTQQVEGNIGRIEGELFLSSALNLIPEKKHIFIVKKYYPVGTPTEFRFQKKMLELMDDTFMHKDCTTGIAELKPFLEKKFRLRHDFKRNMFVFTEFAVFDYNALFRVQINQLQEYDKVRFMFNNKPVGYYLLGNSNGRVLDLELREHEVFLVKTIRDKELYFYYL